mmetsp:Transcript_16068/g.40278  ORF Transcript_16068/g.40278 Transcript_16068/m.40278 type:complete len:234 (-) Transcript_16068:405-1106(-)
MEARRKAPRSYEPPSPSALLGGHVQDNDDRLQKHQNATKLSRTIHWIESQEVPAYITKRRRSGERVVWVSGLNKVLYGTQPAAEVVRVAGIRPPRYLCYMVSGSGCDIIQFVLYVLAYKQFEDASLAWALSFGGSIVFRHTTHRYLVFGDYVGGYWASLRRMYAGYSIIIVLSTIFSYVVTKFFDLPHFVVFILTLLWTGIVNYFILKKLWSFDGTGKKEDKLKSLDIEQSSN